jgi:hypothetical protein
MTFHRCGGPRRGVSRRSCGAVRVGRPWSCFVVTERGRSGLVGQTPVGSGARASCCRAAPDGSNEQRRLPCACHRDVSLLMSSRDPSVNLRPISRSAATAFSRGPGEPARVLVRLPDSAAVSHTRQSPGTPTRFASLPASESVSRAIVPQLLGRIGCDLPIPTACRVRIRALQVALGGLCRHSVRGPPELSERTDPAATERSGRRISPGAQVVSTTIVSTSDTLAVGVPSRRDQFRAIRVSSPWLTGRQSPQPTEGSRAVSAQNA